MKVTRHFSPLAVFDLAPARVVIEITVIFVEGECLNNLRGGYGTFMGVRNTANKPCPIFKENLFM